MELDHLSRAERIGVAGKGFGGMDRERCLIRSLVDCARRPIERRSRLLDRDHHVGEPVLDRLKTTDRAAELDTLFGIGNRVVEARLRTAERVGRDGERARCLRCRQRRRGIGERLGRDAAEIEPRIGARLVHAGKRGNGEPGRVAFDEHRRALDRDDEQIGASAVREVQRGAGERAVARCRTQRGLGKTCDQLARGEAGEEARPLFGAAPSEDCGRGEADACEQRQRCDVPPGGFGENGELYHAESDATLILGDGDPGEAEFGGEGFPQRLIGTARGHRGAGALARRLFGEEHLRRFGDHRLFVGEGEVHLSCPRPCAVRAVRTAACRLPRRCRRGSIWPAGRPSGQASSHPRS